jgi:hypothetical protein
MLHRTKRIVAGLATSLAALGVAIGSGATFNSQSANASNTFTSGTLTQTNSKNGVAILTGANMKPGDVKTGDVTIKNTGTLAGTFTLTETSAANAFGAGDLHLKIEDVTNASAPTQVYYGDLGSVNANGISLGSFASGEQHTYRFTVTLDQNAPNSDQGKAATADYVWTAVQS